MNKTRVLLVVLTVFTCVVGCYRPPAPQIIAQSSAEEQVRHLLPGLSVTFDADRIDRSGPYVIREFFYGMAPAWPYGDGFAVSVANSDVVLWVYLHHGDYSPHQVRWADFDGDGRLDIFFHAGEEEIAETYVYVNRVSGSTFGLANFALAYENDQVYAVVLDFEGDGRPELLEPEPWSDDVDDCTSEFQEFERSSVELSREYRRLAGPFDNWNFKYGVPEDSHFLLSLFERVRITSVFGPVDRIRGPIPSEQVREHLRWRVGQLTNAKPHLSPGCRERVDELVHDLEQELESKAGARDLTRSLHRTPAAPPFS